MSDEKEVVDAVDEAENALETAPVADETTEEVAAPDPAQEEEAAKAEKKQLRRDRKEFFELKAKAEYLERELRRREQATAEPDDIDERVNQRIAEMQQQKAAEEFISKRDRVFAEAAKLGDFDGDDFLRSYKVGDVTADAIMNSKYGSAIAQYLYDNPEDADRIAALSPYGQGKEMAKLEDKFSSAQVKKSAAPTPIKPVGAKGSGEVVYRPDMSDAEYSKWLELQHKSRRG